nr:signal peptidase II [Sporichthya polymorpha]
MLAALDLSLKAWAERDLSDGQAVDLALIELRLVFNPGVAFGLGSALPSALVLAVTGTIVAGLAVFVWRTPGTGAPVTAFALVVVLAGAVSNLADRAADGVVTDYLHTGWFPTFNGADVLITVGGFALVLGSLRAPSPRSGPAASP